MKILIEYPPNYVKIAFTFNLSKGTVFCYGDTLYNPDNGPVDPSLIKHEETHMRQQESMGVEKWWERYLVDVDFRVSQEVEAYQNQYREMKKWIKDKNKLNRLLHTLASALSGPMYGNALSMTDALHAIKSDINYTFVQKE